MHYMQITFHPVRPDLVATVSCTVPMRTANGTHVPRLLGPPQPEVDRFQSPPDAAGDPKRQCANLTEPQPFWDGLQNSSRRAFTTFRTREKPKEPFSIIDPLK